jgi:predicted nucleic acid-binding protein
MRHSHFTVVYDACVLYPAPLRDLLMRLAVTGAFRARWTEKIHDEWVRNLLLSRPDLDPEKLARTVKLMNVAVPDCLVEGYESFADGLGLPDKDDNHVLAAAIRCNANVIVTFNLKDFPAAALEKYEVEAQHPDEFIGDLLDLDAAVVVEAAQKHRASLRAPKIPVVDYLNMLLRQGLTQTVKALTGYQSVL